MKKLLSIIMHWKIHARLLFLWVKVIAECFQSRDCEKMKIARYLLTPHRLCFLPYRLTEKYKHQTVQVYYDEEDYPYVMHKGRKLFMKKEWGTERIQEYYRSLCMEQDKKSPHRYLQKSNRYPDKNCIAADIGAAEGIFALDIITQAAKIYLFECDSEWRRPLEKTFSPWADRVEIVEKYVGSEDKENTVTLDTFFDGKKIDCLKADIEGAEEDMLKGGGTTFRDKLKKVFVCTYHLPGADELIKKILEEYGFLCKFNPGYGLYIYDLDNFKPPLVRRVLVFGIKQKS